MTTDTEELVDQVSNEDLELGVRALKTRDSILDAARRLFLERGYDGTRINNITDTCGISRAGFYTYFKDKREVFILLGRTAYDDAIRVIGQWDQISQAPSREEIRSWVESYFDFMDLHGAFIFSASQSAPDEDYRIGGRRMHVRAAFLLGVAMRSRQATPTEAPEALGFATMALLDRSWFLIRVTKISVSLDDMISTTSDMILATLRTPSEA